MKFNKLFFEKLDFPKKKLCKNDGELITRGKLLRMHNMHGYNNTQQFLKAGALFCKEIGRSIRFTADGFKIELSSSNFNDYKNFYSFGKK